MKAAASPPRQLIDSLAEAAEGPRGQSGEGKAGRSHDCTRVQPAPKQILLYRCENCGGTRVATSRGLPPACGVCPALRAAAEFI